MVRSGFLFDPRAVGDRCAASFRGDASRLPNSKSFRGDAPVGCVLGLPGALSRNQDLAHALSQRRRNRQCDRNWARWFVEHHRRGHCSGGGIGADADVDRWVSAIREARAEIHQTKPTVFSRFAAWWEARSEERRLLATQRQAEKAEEQKRKDEE